MSSSLFLQNVQVVQKIVGLKNSFDLKINTDSRKFQSGETFVALKGENFDGRQYIDVVLKAGSKAVVFTVDEEYESKIMTWETLYPEVVFIQVSDTLKFIQELASAHIVAWKKTEPTKKIIGITGSNGKTTHKEMMSFILKSIFPDRVHSTRGNLNNHIGVPLTIFGLNEKHEIAIIEMGMNHVGEITELSNIAHPEHGMITNIGPAHIEFMKSMENIFKEKNELYIGVLNNSKGNGIFVVNADDKFLIQLKKSNGLITYGEEHGDIRVGIHFPNIEIFLENKKLSITNNNITEHHNLKNLAGVIVFCLKLFPEKEQEILQAAAHYSQPDMNRSQWIQNIFLDAYNANPSSMQISLNSFVEEMQRKNISLLDCYFILGDMNELGEFAPTYHREMGEHLLKLGIKNITFIGRYRSYYVEGFPTPTSSFESKEEFYEEWKHVRKNFKFVFVKASRSLQLESLIAIL